MIEVEIRSFITKEKYEELLNLFSKYGNMINDDEQVTYYFSGNQDLRIQKSRKFSKIWLKKGDMHDEAREEVEIMLPVEEFENLEKLFLELGYKTEIKWFRKRKQFLCRDIEVSLDYTRGYGYIIELERLSTNEAKENVLKELKEKMQELGIEITPKEEFDIKYKEYKENWRVLTREDL